MVADSKVQTFSNSPNSLTNNQIPLEQNLKKKLNQSNFQFSLLSHRLKPTYDKKPRLKVYTNILSTKHEKKKLNRNVKSNKNPPQKQDCEKDQTNEEAKNLNAPVSSLYLYPLSSTSSPPLFPPSFVAMASHSSPKG
jgi:hypothetical protein